MTLFLIAFIAGVLTVLAPCVLPLLPVIVGGSVSGGVNHSRAYVVAFSLGISVILFTLLLKFSTAFIGVPQYAWMWISGGILVLFGIITLFPQIWDRIGLVNKVNRESNKLMSQGFMRQTFWGDVLVGAALGPVFSTCSPTYFVILATVLPASFGVGLADLLSYTVGLVAMLLIVSLVGQRVVDKLGLASDPNGWFRKTIGALFIVVGILVLSGAEAPVESWLISHVYDITMVEQTLLQQRAESTKNPLLCSDGTCKPEASSTEASTSTAAAPTTGQNVNALVSQAKKAMQYPKAPEITDPQGFVNTDGKPITIAQFKGKKVVLIDFWTYSCINCQRTLPYLKSWYDKYHDAGLEIIGIHTPEFAFEHLLSNVQSAVTGFGIKYPVVLDNDYGTWNAFGNQFWPRKYLIDIDGYVVFDHAGEGNYDETEKAIQAALKERDVRLGQQAQLPAVDAAPAGVSSFDERKVGSPEIYFGAMRNEYLGNATPGETGVHTLTMPSSYQPNALNLEGTWDIEEEYAESTAANAKIRFFYNAKSVYFVSSADAPVRIKVTRDGGQSLGAERGDDVDADGYATIKEDRLYKLIQGKEYGAHILEIQIEGKGLKAYTFTFG